VKDAGTDKNKIVFLECFAQYNEQSAANLRERRPAGESLFMVPFMNFIIQLQSADLCRMGNSSANGSTEDRGDALCIIPIWPDASGKCPRLCWFDNIDNSAFWTGGKE
jgi:hypothetical protein